jgi:hypothetical protein
MRHHTKVLLGLVIAVIGFTGPASAGPGAAAQGVRCTDPQFVTSDANGMWSDGGYIVHNNMWNVSGYDVSERLSACSYKNWSVRVTADNSSGDGAVKTYPNVHADFHNWSTGAEPALSSFSRIRSTFAARTPGVGIYNAAYDIWLNGVPGDNEVMIWTDNHNQVPAGELVARGLHFAGNTWKVYATDDNGYLAFVPRHRLTAGTLPLKRMLGWLVAHDRVSAQSTLGQICFGFEVVSTDGQPATFRVLDFAVTTRR